jgi:hypothetical protein
MDKKSNRLDPDFIARPAEPPNIPRSLVPKGASYLQGLPAPPAVPDVFDEARIKHELQKLAGTPGFAKYVTLLKTKFSRATERKALEQWELFYRSAKRTVESHTELVRAQHDHQQVEREYEIKNKQKDLASLTLDAEIEEQRLRVDLARVSRLELEQATRQQQAPATGYGNDNKSALLDQWYQQARKQIMEDYALSLDEQDQMLEQLRAEYNARKRSITIDIG